jgi:hypothetical protein
VAEFYSLLIISAKDCRHVASRHYLIILHNYSWHMPQIIMLRLVRQIIAGHLLVIIQERRVPIEFNLSNRAKIVIFNFDFRPSEKVPKHGSKLKMQSSSLRIANGQVCLALATATHRAVNKLNRRWNIYTAV